MTIPEGDPLALPDGLRERCRAALGGDFRATSRHDHGHGEARVWRLETTSGSGGGDAFFLKCHRQSGKWHSETFAYENWVGPAFGEHAPRLVAAWDGDAPALLTTALPGAPLYTLKQTPEQERAAWSAAGRAIAKLHALARSDWFGSCRRDGTPQGNKPPARDAAAFLTASIRQNSDRAETLGALRPEELRFIRSAARDWTTALDGEPPVPVHRDYSPRNWIGDSETGGWRGVIDFEHSRWDVRAADIQRGWDREWIGRPDLMAAFFDAYLGGPPDDRLVAQVRALRLLNNVGGIRWSVEHGDAAFEAENRANFARLRAEAEGTL